MRLEMSDNLDPALHEGQQQEHEQADCVDQQYRDWGPPPKYQEAISAPSSASAASNRTDAGHSELAPILSQQQQQQASHNNSIACLEGQASSGQTIPDTQASQCDDNVCPDGSSSRSAGGQADGQTEKRKSGSNIMRGLEKAAFFVIDLLD